MTDLRELEAEVVLLREDLDYLATVADPEVSGAAALQSKPRTPPARAHVWDSLTSTEASAAWGTLAEWVDWIVDRYGLDDTIPNCWYRHARLIDELDALRAAWVGAYLGTAAGPNDAAFWQELLTRTAIRLHDHDRYGCVGGTHQDDPLSARDPTAAEHRARHFHDDVAVRAVLSHEAERDVRRDMAAGQSLENHQEEEDS
jgi:hypothetical protein